MLDPAEILTELLEQDRLICALPPDTCEFCGKEAELRPYGPKGERICFSCAMEDEETTKQQFLRRFA